MITFTRNKLYFLVMVGATVSGSFFLFDATRSSTGIVDDYIIANGAEERVLMASHGGFGTDQVSTQTVNSWTWEIDPDIPSNIVWYSYDTGSEVTNSYMRPIANSTNNITFTQTRRYLAGIAAKHPVARPWWTDETVDGISWTGYRYEFTNKYAWSGFSGYLASSFPNGDANGQYNHWQWSTTTRRQILTNALGWKIYDTLGTPPVIYAPGLVSTYAGAYPSLPPRLTTWEGSGGAVAGSMAATGIITGRLTTTKEIYGAAASVNEIEYDRTFDAIRKRQRLNGLDITNPQTVGTYNNWGALDAIHGNVAFILGWTQGALVHGAGITGIASVWEGIIYPSLFLDSSAQNGSGIYTGVTDWIEVTNIATSQWVRLGLPSANIDTTTGLVWFTGEELTTGSGEWAIELTSSLSLTSTLAEAYTVLHDLTTTYVPEDEIQWSAHGAYNYYVWTGTGSTWAAAKSDCTAGGNIVTNISDAVPILGTRGTGLGYQSYQATAYRRNSWLETPDDWIVYDELTNTADGYTIAEPYYDEWDDTDADFLTNAWVHFDSTSPAATNAARIEVGWGTDTPWSHGWCTEPATNAAEGDTTTGRGIQVQDGAIVLRWQPEFCTTAP